MTLDEKRKRRDYLTHRLSLLNVRSDGRDRLERELHHLNIQIAREASESA